MKADDYQPDQCWLMSSLESCIRWDQKSGGWLATEGQTLWCWVDHDADWCWQCWRCRLTNCAGAVMCYASPGTSLHSRWGGRSLAGCAHRVENQTTAHSVIAVALDQFVTHLLYWKPSAEPTSNTELQLIWNNPTNLPSICNLKSMHYFWLSLKNNKCTKMHGICLTWSIFHSHSKLGYSMFGLSP